MKTRDLILKQAGLKGGVKTSEIQKLTGISRQTIAEHFRKLISEKKLIKVGSTRNARYSLLSNKKNAFKKAPSFIKEYFIKGLSEDMVFQEASLKTNLPRKLSNNAYKIINFAFTEMLNNAIDHSKSKKVKVDIRYENGKFQFEVFDKGIGVYESIRKKFKLKGHFEAVEHLLKGKQTSDPKHHTGQGIFFTSKIADKFVLESAKLKLIIDNDLEDTILEDTRFIKGTRVILSLRQRSRKSLKELFNEFSNDDYEFDKTKITVCLSSKESEHVSRSEAKRLLFGLEQFKRIVLDFKKVKGIGQGFADEIFRVYKTSHPYVTIEGINMQPAVEFMVKRANKTHKH